MDLRRSFDELTPSSATAAAAHPPPASSASSSNRLPDRRELVQDFTRITASSPTAYLYWPPQKLYTNWESSTPPAPAPGLEPPQALAPSPDSESPPAPSPVLDSDSPPAPSPGLGSDSPPQPSPDPGSDSPPPPSPDSPVTPPTPMLPAPNSQPPMSTPTLSPQTEPWTSPPHLPLELNPVPAPPSGKTGLIAGASAGSVAVVICGGLLVWWFLFRRRRRMCAAARQQVPAALSGKDKPLEDEFEKLAGPRRFSYHELAIATSFFTEEEKLGEGGFGSVYHGYLACLNLHVAVKRVAKGSQQGRREYVSEVRTISQLRHRNLVQLIGWCHDDNELLLVYQLMPNGSLDTHIHNQNKVLPWQLRHEIVLGIGSAILYLHEGWEQCVLHRDIKPSNMMLDASFNIKLGDFGLARLIDHGQGSHTTRCVGTKGYMDPESMVTGRASTESDVYSFGVVVLEIVSGKQPLLVRQGNEGFTMQLVQLIWECYGDGRILDAADPRLNGEFDRQKMERLMVAALWCVHPDRRQRPSISQAVNVMRFEAPLPTLPAKMPAVTFVLPIDSLLSQSLGATASSSGSSSYGIGTTHCSSCTTRTTHSS